MDTFTSEADLDDWLDEEALYDDELDDDWELDDELDDDWELDDEEDDEFVDLGDAFRRLLHDDYADLSPEETDEVLLDMVESLPPDEAFNFVKALSDIAKPAAGILRSPQLGQILSVAAPLAGTALGGPAGGAIARSLAQAAGSALARNPKVPAVPAAAMPAMATAVGQPAAATAVPQVLAQLPPAAQVAQAATQAANAVKAFDFASLQPVKEAVLAKVMQPYGKQEIAEIPVDQILGTLARFLAGSIPGGVPNAVPGAAMTEAIDDSDEVPVDLFGDEAWPVDDETANAIYETLVAQHQQDLADAAG
jgi:hypothetical protein